MATDRTTDIMTARLNWPRGRFSENTICESCDAETSGSFLEPNRITF